MNLRADTLITTSPTFPSWLLLDQKVWTCQSDGPQTALPVRPAPPLCLPVQSGEAPWKGGIDR
ncbi:hypothetical protein LY76DRAFT_593075, partial [Colletotrichum caudatum]